MAISDNLRDGVLVESRRGRASQSYIRNVHVISELAIWAGEPKDVVLLVHETRDGNFHYSIHRDMSVGARFAQEPTARSPKVSDRRTTEMEISANTAVNIQIIEDDFYSA